MSSIEMRDTNELDDNNWGVAPERFAILGDDQLKGEDSENPFARISCRTRGNRAMCTGTCGECKIKREKYKSYFIIKSLRDEEINSSGDPDFEKNDADHYGTILKMKIATWNKRKEEIIAQRNETIQEARTDISKIDNRGTRTYRTKFSLLSDAPPTHIDIIH